jgi:hypothetical protein
VENIQPDQKTGRPKNKTRKEACKLPLDPATLRMLEELEVYGRLGTTKQEIVMYILRSWLWENEARLKAGIASRDNPFGGTSEASR